MIKLKDLLTEQKSSTIINWLNTYKKDFMGNLKKVGFNPRGFALNQLSIPNSDKTMGGASLPQWYASTVKKQAFDSASKPQKLVTNPKALASSVTTNEIILNKKNLVYIDSKAFAGGNFDSQQKLNQSTKWGKSYFGNSVTTICASANASNLAQYRSGNAQIIAINPIKGKNYNEVVIGKSPNLHLYSTRDVATKTVPGKEGKPGKVIEIPDIPAINFGGLFQSGQSTLTNPAQGRTQINQAIQTAAAANIGIAQMGTFLVSAGTDQQGSTANNTQLAQNRANSIMALLRAAGVPENQIQIDISRVEDGPVPPPAGSSAQQIAQWRQSTQNFRFVTLSFPGLDTDDKVIPPTKPTPPTKVDAPKKVTINHLEVFLKK